MPEALIFGAGGHAGVIASLLPGHAVRFVVREASETAEPSITEGELFDRIDDFRGHDVYIGIGSNAAREAVFRRLAAHGIAPANCIAANAFVAANARLGQGVVVCPGSAIMANARIGDNAIVNTLSSIDHDCTVGDHAQVTAGVTFGGGVTLGSRCFVGVKAAIVPGVTIGDDTIVMAGSLVTADIPAGVMVGGSPARVVRKLGG